MLCMRGDYMRLAAGDDSRRDLEDDSLVVGSSLQGGAVEVAAGINDQTAVWGVAVAAGEVVKHGHRPCPARRRELEDRAIIAVAALGSAIQVAGGICHQPAEGTRSGGQTADRTEAPPAAGRCQLESYARLVRSRFGRAIEIAIDEDEAGSR